MLCGFCKDSDIYKVDFMYDLVDFLEAKFRNRNESEAALLDMI